MDCPSMDELYEISAVVERDSDEPWIVSVQTWASDETEVFIAWDPVVESVHIELKRGGTPFFVSEREVVGDIRVQKIDKVTQFIIHPHRSNFLERIVISIGTHVEVYDSSLIG